MGLTAPALLSPVLAGGGTSLAPPPLFTTARVFHTDSGGFLLSGHHPPDERRPHAQRLPNQRPHAGDSDDGLKLGQHVGLLGLGEKREGGFQAGERDA